MHNAEELLGHATAITELACAEALRHFRQQLQVEFKPDESPVTVADRAVEQAVRDYLQQHLPNHSVFGEEFGEDAKDKANLWIIDPIDGTRSFLSGHPLFGFLLAFCTNGTADTGYYCNAGPERDLYRSY